MNYESDSTEKQRSDLTGRPVTEWRHAGWEYSGGFDNPGEANNRVVALSHPNVECTTDYGPGAYTDDTYFRVFTRPKTPTTRTFAPTGSVRDDRTGKGRYDLESPFARKDLVEALEAGSGVYSPRNWELGQPLSWYYDSASRHLTNWWANGDRKDAVAAMVNLHMLVHTLEMVDRGVVTDEVDDRPDYTGN